MKKYFIQYKPFLIFLASFFLTYFILTFIYQQYLGSLEKNKTDAVTKFVSKNTEQILLFFGEEVSVVESDTGSYMKLFFHKEYIARIVEGCNAISIIILFVSFVVAFSSKLIPTLLFIFCGSIIIYLLNVFRIAALTVLLFYFPKQEVILHEVLFPLFIYSVVFLLWLIWVRKFSKYVS